MKFILLCKESNPNFWPIMNALNAFEQGAVTFHAASQKAFMDGLAEYPDAVGVLLFESVLNSQVMLLQSIRDEGLNNYLFCLYTVTGDHMRQVNACVLMSGADQSQIWPMPNVLFHSFLKAMFQRGDAFAEARNGRHFKFGDVLFDADAGSLSRGSSLVNLTKTEIRMMEFFILRRGVIIPKGLMLQHIYGSTGDIPGEKIIDIFMCKLRRKIRSLSSIEFIETVWAQGFRFEPNGVWQEAAE